MLSTFDLWGGLECTLNRVHDEYFDQFQLAGHYQRESLLKRFQELKFSAFRFPVLWEKYGALSSDDPEWQFATSELEYLRLQQITPIVGLVHHGSGPKHASIETPGFASELAGYARQVACRFPWVEWYTPVNEPLTTARFCGLYGHWFPHEASDRSFVTILMNECRATILAMKAIREINPGARLLQTEDLGKTYSTSPLAAQADFENVRRFLSLDLLCGKVTACHPLWHYLLQGGATVADLMFFQEHACPPDQIGFNYYITSERFLDHNLQHYPAHTLGGNGRQHYADVEAIRVNLAEPSGLYPLLKEAWKRYDLPLAITEVHLNSSPSEQLRWVQYISEAVERLQQEGADIRAITLWALTGAYGWDKLLADPQKGTYESGLLDLREGDLGETEFKKLLLGVLHSTASGQPCHPGWWEQPGRIAYSTGTDTPFLSSCV